MTGPRDANQRIVKPPVDREVEEELAHHVEMRVRELVAEGWTEEDARTEAYRRFGDLECESCSMASTNFGSCDINESYANDSASVTSDGSV